MNQNLSKIGYSRTNSAKIWQIAFFALNNSSTNSFLILMNLVSYYTFGPAGLVVSVLLNISTVMRLFDGITDPIIGTLLDRTNTRFGKYRPFIIIGQLIMAITVFCLYSYVNLISNRALAYFVFVILYAIYIIGYTCQTACTKAGQTVLTNDPKQRPLFSFFDSVYTTLLFTFFSILLPVVSKKYGSLANQNLFNEMMRIFIPISFFCALFAIIGLWSKDNNKYFIKNDKKVKFRDFIPVIKHNRAIKMLIISAATDKLAVQLASNTLVTTLLFAVILGNYSLSAQIALPISICTIGAIWIGVSIARKFGQKRALVWSTTAALIGTLLFSIVMIIINPRGEKMILSSITGIIFVIFYTISRLGMSVTGGIVIPMIADCSDYETVISGKSVPGLMATLFSFVDKLFSSLATTVLSFLVIWALGSKGKLDVSTPYSNKLFIMFILSYVVFPIIGYLATLVAMKFYPLNQKTMLEVKEKLNEIRYEQNLEDNLVLNNDLDKIE